MTKRAKIERAQKNFLKAMKEKFSQDPTGTTKTLVEIQHGQRGGKSAAYLDNNHPTLIGCRRHDD